MLRSRGVVTGTQGLFLSVGSPVTCFEMPRGQRKTAGEGLGCAGRKIIHLHGKLQTRWKRFLPSEGSLQACSGAQHFGGGEAGNDRLPHSRRQPSQDGSSVQHLEHSALCETVGASWDPLVGQHSPRNSLHQNSEPSRVITFRLAGALPAPSPRLYQTRQTPESEFI